MRNIILGLVASVLLVACSGNDRAKDFLKNKKHLSDIEIKDFEFKNSEMSDREYYDKIASEHGKQAKLDSELSIESAKYDLDLQAKYIDSAGKSNGNKKYKMTMYYKMQGKDTTKLGYLYYNDIDKLIYANGIR